MPIQSSGPISFTDLVREMEGLYHDQEGNDIDNTNISMSRYYGDRELPSSGPISLGDFYGKYSIKELSFSYRGKITGDESLYANTPLVLTRNYDGYPLDVEIVWTDDGSTHHFTTDGTTHVNTNQTLSFPISTIENTAKQISGNVAHTPNFTVGDSTSQGYYSIVLPEGEPGEYVLGQYPEFSYEVQNNDYYVNTGQYSTDTSTGMTNYDLTWTTDGTYIWALANSLGFTNTTSGGRLGSVGAASYFKIVTTETEAYYRRRSTTTTENWPNVKIGNYYYNYRFRRDAAIVSDSSKNIIYVLTMKPAARSGRTSVDYGLPYVVTLVFSTNGTITTSEKPIGNSSTACTFNISPYVSHFAHSTNPTARVYAIGQRVDKYTGANTGHYILFWVGRNGFSGSYTATSYNNLLSYANGINALSNDADNDEDRGFVRVFEDLINTNLV